jgi:RNA polymerase sigma factor (sigma-70 family)
MIAKCLKEAKTIISWFCNVNRISDDLRDEYYSAGMMGLAVAIRSHKKISQLNTYTAHFVKGYLRRHHYKVMGWERNRAKSAIDWSNFHETINIDKHHNNLYLSKNGVASIVEAKDLMSKVFPILSPRQKQVFDLLMVGKGPAEIGRELGITRFSVNGYRVQIKRKIKELTDEPETIRSRQNTPSS